MAQSSVRRNVMPRVNAKRQITLPVALCREAGIEPGDAYRCFVADGRITIVRKEAGAARGFLRPVTGDRTLSDDESLRNALDTDVAAPSENGHVDDQPG